MSTHPLRLSAGDDATYGRLALRLRRAASHASPATRVEIRRAVAADEAAIVALVRSERLNPSGLHWERFWVAASGGGIVGAAQIRHHDDGAREVGSVVVAEGYRRRGIAAELLDALLAGASDELHLVTRRALVGYYGRWGFEPISPALAPRSVRRNFWLGQLIGGALSCLSGRAPRKLFCMRRAAPGHPRGLGRGSFSEVVDGSPEGPSIAAVLVPSGGSAASR